MGTRERREREKEARRQLILTAARRMLSEKGFKNASIEDVAHEAELSPGAIYLYFKSKNEILATLLLNSLRYFNIRMRQISDENGKTPEEKIYHMKTALKDLLAFDPLIFHQITHLHSSKAVEQLSSSVTENIKVIYRQIFSAMTEIFRKSQTTGIARSVGPEHCTNFICSLFLGIICQYQSQVFSAGDLDSFKQLLDGAFEIFLNGISG